MALTGSAPFQVLKTQGLIVDKEGEPVTLSSEKDFNPADLIEGTVKQSGERLHGYGIDTVRAWAVTKDTDKHIHMERDDIEQVN